MIEILKVSEGEDTCIRKLIQSIEQGNKCLLIVDSNDYDLAISLKKKHILMDTFVEEDYYEKNSLLFAFPNVQIKKKSIYKSDVKDNDVYLGIITLDIDNLDTFNNFIVRLHQSYYFKKDLLKRNYAYIVLSNRSFLINRNSESSILVENGILNLIPQSYFFNKSLYTMMPKNGLSIIGHFDGEKYYDIFSKIISNLTFLLSNKGMDITQKDNDLFIKGKKFFGGLVSTEKEHTEKSTLLTLVLFTNFELEKEFFFNTLKYHGKYEYTGLFEETNAFDFQSLIKYIINLLLILTY